MISLPCLILLAIVPCAQQTYIELLNNCRVPIMVERLVRDGTWKVGENISLAIGQHALFIPPNVAYAADYMFRLSEWRPVPQYKPIKFVDFQTKLHTNWDYVSTMGDIGSIWVSIKSDRGFYEKNGNSYEPSPINILFSNGSASAIPESGYAPVGSGYTVTYCP